MRELSEMPSVREALAQLTRRSASRASGPSCVCSEMEMSSSATKRAPGMCWPCTRLVADVQQHKVGIVEMLREPGGADEHLVALGVAGGSA